jgi:Fe2+ or Zn2+ uptake regulation protein
VALSITTPPQPPAERPLTRLQRRVLDLVVLYGPDVSSYQLYEEYAKRHWFPGNVYVGLRFLEDKGVITMRRVPGGPERGGHDRFLYSVVWPWH